MWTTTDDDPVLDTVAASGLPTVIHAGPQRPGMQVVGIDDQVAAAAIGREAFIGATRPVVLSFPLDRGRRRELLTGPTPPVATFPVTRHRLAGFQHAWTRVGGDPARLRYAICPANSQVHGESLAFELLTGDYPPDAIAAMSGELALGALRAAQRAGQVVPDTLAITGWDDSEAAAPAELTTLAQSLRDQGARCAHITLGHAEPAERDHSHGRWHVVKRTTTRRTG